MATKKAPSKKATSAEAATPAIAEKAPAKKTAAKKTAAVKAPTTEPQATAAHVKETPAKPTHHDIAVHAYLLWEREGKPHGQHEDYWHKAERELNG